MAKRKQKQIPNSDEPNSDEDLGRLLQLVQTETVPQARAKLWGEIVCHVLSLEDIREGLTFDEIQAMSDEEANELAERMQAVFEFRATPPSKLKRRMRASTTHHGALSSKAYKKLPNREAWPKDVATSILVKCHFRCCVCPDHRRIADIHHIDGDHSNSIEANGVALCKECHSDAHSTSTMRRNLRGEHLIDL